MAAICNSTLIALLKIFYGRYTGTEGGLEIMIVDLNLLEIPDPRFATPTISRKLNKAFNSICQRDTGCMGEEVLMDCRSWERAQKLALSPIQLPWELLMNEFKATLALSNKP
jgi:hypothetical protein